MIQREMNEECGVVGVLGDPQAAQTVYLALFAQQHRGQEGCGIITYDACGDADSDSNHDPNGKPVGQSRTDPTNHGANHGAPYDNSGGGVNGTNPKPSGVGGDRPSGHGVPGSLTQNPSAVVGAEAYESEADGAGFFRIHKAFGLVSDSVTREVLEKLKGCHGIGHVRYSTQGGQLIQNVQPLNCRTSLGPLAVCHNGNLTNAQQIRTELENSGSIFQSTSDSEVFIHLIARGDGASLRERIAAALSKVRGAYSVVLLAKDRMFGMRDPHGFRPLVIGRRGRSTILCSETCALDLIDAEYVRDVEPGELVEIRSGDSLPISHNLSHDRSPDRSGHGSDDRCDVRSEDRSHMMSSYFPLERKPQRFCSFEPVYFARPDSVLGGSSIYELRKRMGTVLAQESPAQGADMVIAVPDSGVPMAMGFAEAAGVPLELGLVRNHYVGRTFIQPAQDIRDFAVKLKLNPVLSALKDKSVVVVDDSIVRGTTSAKIMRMLRQAGAREIHMRIGSPPITHSCFYGVDTSRRENLLAAQKNVDSIRDFIGCDSLAYLSLEGLKEALGDRSGERHCFACLDGRYEEEIFKKITPQPTDVSGGPGLRSGCS